MNVHCLTVGINAYPAAPLAGCVNDAIDWSAEWEPAQRTSKQLLNAKATRRNILREINGLFDRCKRGDWALISLSGHGSQVRDTTGDEPDGWDECFCGYDYEKQVILDDEFAANMENRPPGVRVFVVSDACHSATMFRAAAFVPLRREWRGVRYLSPDRVQRAKVHPVPRSTVRIPAGVIWLSGCQDNDYSYDGTFDGRPNGALTRNAIDALHSLRAPTFANWIKAIRRRLPCDDYPQTPALNALAAEKKWRVPWL